MTDDRESAYDPCLKKIQETVFPKVGFGTFKNFCGQLTRVLFLTNLSGTTLPKLSTEGSSGNSQEVSGDKKKSKKEKKEEKKQNKKGGKDKKDKKQAKKEKKQAKKEKKQAKKEKKQAKKDKKKEKKSKKGNKETKSDVLSALDHYQDVRTQHSISQYAPCLQLLDLCPSTDKKCSRLRSAAELQLKHDLCMNKWFDLMRTCVSSGGSQKSCFKKYKSEALKCKPFGDGARDEFFSVQQ
eukprot:TRINITY_DN516_c0_g1_i4.p1 TRINITY_DN516_c0_g1~~TRINITY_DN516_c0_g1_i4.p1  ORF type:complete len:239 (-),score=64.89 TRINITY_DN516_c0_g1_i4:100-816(-)